MRIVSLLPSATEIVCALGLEEQLVGVTHECDYPASVTSLPAVTRTLIPADAASRDIDKQVREQLQSNNALYQLDLPVLESLQPDLIVTQALCDVCAVAEDEVQAAARELPSRPAVINLEPLCLDDLYGTLRQVAVAAHVEDRAEEVVDRLRARVDAVSRRSDTLDQRPKVALLEWLDPPFSCGHWSPELVRLAGGREVLGREGQPSRTLNWEEVVDGEPEVLFVACCGFTAERAMEDVRALASEMFWRQLPAVQSGRVYVVDGSQYFSRPGPRLVESLEILAHTIASAHTPQARGCRFTHSHRPAIAPGRAVRRH
ncbi:MAG: cobalamin-binding protein [Halioglobus sp.]|nr:cobalamin-binding protein [Halioglobus sp.]